MFKYQTILSPLDQFEIRNLFSIDTPLLANINLSITNIALYMTIAAFLAFYFSILATNNSRITPNSWSLSQETLYATIHSIVINQINNKNGQVYFPLMYALFIFILINNLIGMIPYSFAFTPYVYLIIFCVIFLIICPKDRITIKKLLCLTIIVIVTPLILHFINFILPYLLENFIVILFAFNNLIYKLLVFFVSRMQEVLLKFCSKKGFIDILTSVCIIYVIKVVLLSSLFILNIVSNLFITNNLFSLIIDFYSITLIKILTPYVENIFSSMVKIYTSIVKPIFNSYFPPVRCDSPEEVAKLFSELPFSNVDSEDMVTECKTTRNKLRTRKEFAKDFEKFHLNIGLNTPMLIVSMQSGSGSGSGLRSVSGSGLGSGFESNPEQGEPHREQLDKSKKRALDNTQEVGCYKRAKINRGRGNTNSSIITNDDLNKDLLDLYSIYEKLLKSTNSGQLSKNDTISMLFSPNSVIEKVFYDKLQALDIINSNYPDQTTIRTLTRSIYPWIINYTGGSLISFITKNDFTEDGLDLERLKNKVKQYISVPGRENYTIGKLFYKNDKTKTLLCVNLKDLELIDGKHPLDVRLSTLINRLDKASKPSYGELDNIITKDDITENGLCFSSIISKLEEYTSDPEKKNKKINSLFTRNSPIKMDFFKMLTELRITSPNEHKGSIKITNLINRLDKVSKSSVELDSVITKDDITEDGFSIGLIIYKLEEYISHPDRKTNTLNKLFTRNSPIKMDFYKMLYDLHLAKRSESVGSIRIATLINRLKQGIDFKPGDVLDNIITKDDITENGLCFSSIISKLEEYTSDPEKKNKNLNSIFTRYSPIKRDFYKMLYDLHLTNDNKNVGSIKITTLIDRLGKASKPNYVELDSVITKDDITENGLCFSSIISKLEEYTSHPDRKTNTLNKLFTRNSPIKMDFYKMLYDLHLAKNPESVGRIRIATLIDRLIKLDNMHKRLDLQVASYSNRDDTQDIVDNLDRDSNGTNSYSDDFAYNMLNTYLHDTSGLDREVGSDNTGNIHTGFLGSTATNSTDMLFSNTYDAWEFNMNNMDITDIMYNMDNMDDIDIMYNMYNMDDMGNIDS